MTKRVFLSLTILGLLPLLLALIACSAQGRTVQRVSAAPNVFSGPANGGCYLDTITTCRIHVDNWQPIVVDTGQKLAAFQLLAVPGGSVDGSVVYDFRTDVSNPPGSYLPSLVKKDFAAQCGVSYQLLLRAQDTGDLDYEEVGRTNEFQCPMAATATPSPTATTMATPGATATTTATPEVTVTATAPVPAWRVYLPAIH